MTDDGVNLYIHFMPSTDTNSYCLGPDGPGEAIIIDPGSIDAALLHHIEDSDYRLAAVLVTRPRDFHVSGIRTIKRIYDAEIIAPCRSLLNYPCRMVEDGDRLRVGRFNIRVLGMPRHARDSVVYEIEGMLFTGDLLTAGIVDVSATPYGRALLAETIRDELFTFPEHTPIFSTFGPPSTVGVEASINPDCAPSPQQREPSQ